MELVRAESMAKAWAAASAHLLRRKKWVDTNLVLCVEQPLKMDAGDAVVVKRIDALLADHALFSSHTVAETIFPGYEYRRRGVKGVYENYPESVFPRLLQLPEVRRWGTYAHRLLRATDEHGQSYNPLQKCIAKMKDKSPKKAAYELGFGYGFDLATYDDTRDSRHRLGGPCLSHLSFKLLEKKVHLTALYRSHYYVHRAYGNLLGLARLQSFVADQVGVSVGTLVCHSTMARLEYGGKYGWGKTDVETLVNDCNA